MKTLEELIAIINKSNRTQLWYMIYDFEMMGFYREDKRVQKKFLIGCLKKQLHNIIKRKLASLQILS